MLLRLQGCGLVAHGLWRFRLFYDLQLDGLGGQRVRVEQGLDALLRGLYVLLALDARLLDGSRVRRARPRPASAAFFVLSITMRSNSSSSSKKSET